MSVRSSFVGVLVFMLGAAGVTACSDPRRQSPLANRPDIEAVRMRHENDLMRIDGVVGLVTGRCGDDACLILMVVHDTDAIRREVPITIEGYVIRVLEAGDVRIDAHQPSN